MARPQLSTADHDRLQQHFDAIRDAEVTMGNMADQAACSTDGLDTSRLDALRSGLAFQTDGMIEDVVKLHMSVTAVAFACNYNRVATLQWGDGTDQTKYAVPSNATLGWPFHHISHRVQSDSDTGMNPTAEQAHIEIDALRMETLAAGLDHFASRGLQDSCFVMWTNHVPMDRRTRSRTYRVILWGNAGGYLKQGQYVDAANSGNNKLLNTLISANDPGHGRERGRLRRRHGRSARRHPRVMSTMRKIDTSLAADRRVAGARLFVERIGSDSEGDLAGNAEARGVMSHRGHRRHAGGHRFDDSTGSGGTRGNRNAGRCGRCSRHGLGRSERGQRRRRFRRHLGRHRRQRGGRGQLDRRHRRRQPERARRNTERGLQQGDGPSHRRRRGRRANHYFAFPESYDGTKPFPVLVGFHGCGAGNRGTSQSDTEWMSYTKGSAFETDYVRMVPLSADSGGCWNYATDITRVTQRSTTCSRTTASTPAACSPPVTAPARSSSCRS